MKARFSIRTVALVASAGLAAGLDMYSGSDDSATLADRSEDTIKVVTFTKIWIDIVDAVTNGEKISVDSIITSSDIDPYSYEPAAADMAKVEDADILIASDGHHDAWPTSPLRDTKNRVIISALLQEEGHRHGHNHEGHDGREGRDDCKGHEHDHDHEGHDDRESHEGHGYHHHDSEADEHVWYGTDAVEETAEQLVDALAKLGAKADVKAVDKETEGIEEAKSRLKAAKVAQVHLLADDILKDTGVENITPKGYRQSVPDKSELSASGVNEMLKLIESGELDYFTDTPQIHDQASQCPVEAAKAKGVKITDASESPSADQSSSDFYKQTLSDMESA